MSLSPSRRAACLHTYFNAFLWGLGSSLASAHLLRYLVRDLCLGQPSSQVYATVAWIIAAPRLIGVLRLFAPALIKRMGHRKKFCIAFLLAAPIVMAALPLLLPGLVLHAKQTEQIVPVLVLLVVFWCLHHLLEYFGTIALVSWLGDLVPQRIRGRFLGWREAWLIAGMTLGMTALAAWSYFVIDNMPDETARWEGYLLPAKLGIISLLCSPLPLFFVPHVKPRNITQQAHKIRWDARFAWFVLFGCWVQMSQALTQGVQYGFSMNIVGISLLFSMLMSTETRVGQWLAAPLGRKMDGQAGHGPGDDVLADSRIRRFAVLLFCRPRKLVAAFWGVDGLDFLGRRQHWHYENDSRSGSTGKKCRLLGHLFRADNLDVRLVYAFRRSFHAPRF